MTTFEYFWSVYPRRVAKKDARKAWQKLNPNTETVEAIINNIEARQQAGEWDDAKYIPHPATYLNGERWEDEISTPEAQNDAVIDKFLKELT